MQSPCPRTSPVTDRIRLETQTAGVHVVLHSRASKARIFCFTLGFAALWTWVMLECPFSIEQLGLQLSKVPSRGLMYWGFLAVPLTFLPGLSGQLR